MSNVLRKSYFQACTVLIIMVGGCSGNTINGSAARQRLIEAMRPFEGDGNVEMSGSVRNLSDSNRESFILIMGSKGKYMYRKGPHLFFSDGVVRGSIDYSTFPPGEFTTQENVSHEDVAMAVGMLGAGPYPFALARAARDSRWLSSIIVGDDAVYQSRKYADGRLEVTVNDGLQEHFFLFSNPGLRPLRHRIRDLTGSTTSGFDIEYSIVRFPEQIDSEDKVFRPDRASQR